jgi:uncharacterized membrane protein
VKKLKDIVPYGKAVAALIIGAAPPPRQLLGWPILVSILAYCGVVHYIKPRVHNRRKEARTILLVIFFLGIAVIVAYLGELPVRTTDFQDQKVIIGDTLQAEAQTWIENNKSNPIDVFNWRGGIPERVWTPQSLATNIRIIAALYFCLIFSISFVLLGTVEFIPEETNWTWLWILLSVLLLIVAVIFALYYDMAYSHILRGMFSRLFSAPA